MPDETDIDGKNRDSNGEPYDFEKIARILSLIAIPVVIAIVGWIIQNRLSEQNLSQEYVKLAVSILEKPRTSEAPAGLRDWAVDLLNQNSPTKFGADTIRQLKSGEINLSGVIGNLVATMKNGGAFAVSPDGQAVATVDDNGQIRIWDLTTGRFRTTVKSSGEVTALAYAPDGSSIYFGSTDGAINVWNLATGQTTMRMRTTHGPIVGLALTPDGKSLVARTADRYLLTWDVPSQRLVSEAQLAIP